MLIEGPFSIQLIEDTETLKREIHVNFTEEFQQLDLHSQNEKIENHISKLQSLIADTDPGSADYQGMVMMLQFSQEIKPELENGSMQLDETIVIGIEQTGSISSLSNDNSLH